MRLSGFAGSPGQDNASSSNNLRTEGTNDAWGWMQKTLEPSPPNQYVPVIP